jgi:DNA-binding FadR family transcriptional regulator
VQDLGQGIADGSIAVGTLIGPREVEELFGVSRGVSREALRVLQSKGLVVARQNVGTEVNHRLHWNLLDPDVVKWRVHSSEIGEQMRELTGLRAAIEPWAAGEAARVGEPDGRRKLLNLAEEMVACHGDGDIDSFARLDERFHEEIMTLAANPMILRLSVFITEALSARRELLWPERLDSDNVERHRALAIFISQGNAEAAESASRAIVEEARESIERTLSRLQPVIDDRAPKPDIKGAQQS